MQKPTTDNNYLNLFKIILFEIQNGGIIIPKYFVIHPLIKSVQEAMINLAPEKNKMLKDLKAKCTEEANWIRSWAVPDQGKFYCEWDAKDPEAIREMFEGGIEIEAIYELHVIEGKDYEEKVLAEAVQ